MQRKKDGKGRGFATEGRDGKKTKSVLRKEWGMMVKGEEKGEG